MTIYDAGPLAAGPLCGLFLILGFLTPAQGGRIRKPSKNQGLFIPAEPLQGRGIRVPVPGRPENVCGLDLPFLGVLVFLGVF